MRCSQPDNVLYAFELTCEQQNIASSCMKWRHDKSMLTTQRWARDKPLADSKSSWNFTVTLAVSLRKVLREVLLSCFPQGNSFHSSMCEIVANASLASLTWFFKLTYAGDCVDNLSAVLNACVCVRASVYARTHACLCMLIFVRMHACVYIYIYTLCLLAHLLNRLFCLMQHP
jgi:hypothetical protein